MLSKGNSELIIEIRCTVGVQDDSRLTDVIKKKKKKPEGRRFDYFFLRDFQIPYLCAAHKSPGIRF